MVARTRRAGRMPPDERRAAIVEASLPLVLEHGVAVSTRQIAQAADIAEGTIFRVFPDKEALMRAVVAQACDPEPTLRELAAVDRGLPLADRLVAGVQILQRRLTGVFGLFDALGMTGPPPEERTAAPECRPPDPRSMNDAFAAALVDIVGPDHHHLRVPAVEVVRVLRLLVFAGTHPRINEGRALSPRETVAILLDGLLLRPAHRDHQPDHPAALRHDLPEERTC